MDAILELKKLVEDQGHAVVELRKTVADTIKTETKGLVDTMLKDKLEKINIDIDRCEKTAKEIRDLAAQFARQPTYDEKTGRPIVQRPADAEAVNKSFGDFLAGREAGVLKGGEGYAWDTKQGAAAKAVETKSMSIVSAQDGGYLAPTDFAGRTVRKIFETSPIRQVANVTSTSNKELSGIYDNDEMAGGWVSETGGRPTTNTAKIGRWMIPVFELYAQPALSQELLEDASLDIEEYASAKVADKISRIENAAFVAGSGIGQPRGFLSYPMGTTAIVPVAGTAGQIQQVHSGSATTFTYLGLNNMLAALKDQYRARAEWAASRLSIWQIRALVDGFGRPLWGEANLNAGLPPTLLGTPVNEFNDMPTAAASANALALADWKEFYQIVDRIGLSILRDPFTAKPFVLLYTRKRVGGGVLNFEAGVLQLISA